MLEIRNPAIRKGRASQNVGVWQPSNRSASSFSVVAVEQGETMSTLSQDRERSRHWTVAIVAANIALAAIAPVTSAAPVTDPSDQERTLDTFFEIVVAKEVATLEDAFEDLRFALRLERNCEEQ